MEAAVKGPVAASDTALGNGPQSVAPVYEVLAHDLKTRGVEAVFGLPSDDTLALIVALQAKGVRFQCARHETQAVMMAEGYAFATGRLGVAVIGRGPATTNALTGTMSASRTGSKVLVILGDAALEDAKPNVIGPDIKEIKGLGAVGVYAAAGLRAFPVMTVDAARATVAEAAAYAELGRLACVHMPSNVLGATIEISGEALAAATPTAEPPVAVDAVAINEAAELLRTAARPLILAGRGAHLAGVKDELEKLAAKIGAILGTTFKAKDMFAGNPYNVGIVGSFSHSAGRRFIEQADCVLVVGAGLNLFTMSHGTSLPPVPIVHVDAVRAHIGRWTAATVAVVGDARAVVSRLIDAVPERSDDEKPFHSEETRNALSAFEHTDDFVDASSPRNMDPRSLALELDRVLPKNRSIVYDQGNFLAVVPYLSVPGPDHVKMTSDFGSIGLGFGTALGMARGRPDDPVVLVIGDGALLMVLGELETVVREDLRMIVVVMNDRAYGAERHVLANLGLPVGVSLHPEADFASLATDLGYEAHTVTTLADLRELEGTLAEPQAPILLDCLINPEVQAPYIGELFPNSH